MPGLFGVLHRVFLEAGGHPPTMELDCQAVDSGIEQGRCSAHTDAVGGEVPGFQTLADGRSFDGSRDLTRADVPRESGGVFPCWTRFCLEPLPYVSVVLGTSKTD